MPEIHVLILCEISEPFLALVYINLYQSPYLFGLIVFDLSMPFQTIHIFSVLSYFFRFSMVLPLRHGRCPVHSASRTSLILSCTSRRPSTMSGPRLHQTGHAPGNPRTSYDP